MDEDQTAMDGENDPQMQRVQRLSDQLASLRDRSERLTRLIDLACNRRVEQRETWPRRIQRDQFPGAQREMTLAPVELLVSRTAAEPVPVVRDEILVPLNDQRRDAARDALLDLGFTDDFEVADGDEGCEDVLRFRRRADTRRTSLALALRTLAALGLPASPHHVAALRGDMKSTDGPEYTDQPPSWTGPDGTEGNAAPVVVVDTGLDPDVRERDDHWLDGMVEGSDLDPLDVFTERTGAVGPDDHLDGGAGHGTFVAGLVRQAAPRADVAVLRALDTRGVGTECAIARAIRKARDHFSKDERGLGVLNLSLGIQTADGLPPFVVEEALRALPPNVLVIAAAGNTQQDEPIWPAWSKRALGIGALTRDKDGHLVPAPWSNSGPHVDFSAVGDGVSSTYVRGRESTVRDDDPEVFPRRDPVQNESYALWSGTSFSTPKIAGLLAKLLHEHAGKDDPAASAVKALRDRGRYLPGYGYVIDI